MKYVSIAVLTLSLLTHVQASEQKEAITLCEQVTSLAQQTLTDQALVSEAKLYESLCQYTEVTPKQWGCVREKVVEGSGVQYSVSTCSKQASL